jgi:hypothetical protein
LEPDTDIYGTSADAVIVEIQMDFTHYPPSYYPASEDLIAVCSFQNLQPNHHQLVRMVHLMEVLSELIEVKERKHKTPFANTAKYCWPRPTASSSDQL